MSLSERRLVAARLREQMPDVPTHEGAVPDGADHGDYLLVRTSTGRESSDVFADVTRLLSPSTWVTCVSSHTNPQRAADNADGMAERVRDAMRDYRPEATGWAFRPVGGLPATRRELAGITWFEAVEQFTRQSQLIREP